MRENRRVNKGPDTTICHLKRINFVGTTINWIVPYRNISVCWHSDSFCWVKGIVVEGAWIERVRGKILRSQIVAGQDRYGKVGNTFIIGVVWQIDLDFLSILGAP